MKAQALKSTAHRGSKQVKRISREVRVKNLQAQFGIDQEALCTLLIMANTHKNAQLFYKVCECLRGFDDQMQNEMVEALALYYNGSAHTITCIEHVDLLLLNLYKEIDRLLLNTKKK